MKLIAENLTVTDPGIRDALVARDPAPFTEIARTAKRLGVDALDLNLGPRRRGLTDSLGFALETLRETWEGGLWIDGSDPYAMELAVELWPGKPVLNGYAGGGDREEVLKVAARHDCELVIFLMTGKGVPSSSGERIKLAASLVDNALGAGVSVNRLIIDPVLLPLGWMDGQQFNVELVDTLGELKLLFGPEIRSVVGLSNLLTRSTGSVQAAWLAQTFLAFAAGAGLTHAMVDIKNPALPLVARALQVFRGERAFAAAEFEDSPTP